MSSQRNILLLIVLIILVVVALAALTVVNFRFSAGNPGGNDFLARWTGARYWLIDGISPYDRRVSLAAQQMIYGRPAIVERGEDVAHFVYPLYSMVFFGPFGLLDYIPARAIWMTLLQVSLVLTVLISFRLVNWRLGALKMGAIVLFSLLWYPSVRTFILGQFAGLNVLLVVGALWLIRQRQDFAAGAFLALSTAKPQMTFLLVPFVLIWGFSVRRRDLVFGTLLSFFLLVVVSLFLVPGWPLQWVFQLMEYRSYTELGSVISIITSYTPGIRGSLNVFFHLVTLFYLFAEWIVARGKDESWFMWTAFMTLVITNFVAWRTATTHFPLLLPVLFLIFRVVEERLGRVGQLGVAFSMLLIGVGLWILFLQTAQGNLESPVMYLPVPIISLIGMWWVRWWVLNPPRLLIDRIAQWDAR